MIDELMNNITDKSFSQVVKFAFRFSWRLAVFLSVFGFIIGFVSSLWWQLSVFLLRILS